MARRGRKEFDKLGNTYFITTTVLNFIKIFPLNEKYYDILIETLKHVIKEHSATLIAYVFMPNHIHFIVYMPEGESISDLMRDFKKYTSFRIKKELESDNKLYLIEKFKEFSGTGNYKLWKDRFDSQIIVTEKVLTTKINYIHFNPVKAGLVSEMTNWKYSSASNYYKDDHSLIEVSTNWEYK